MIRSRILWAVILCAVSARAAMTQEYASSDSRAPRFLYADGPGTSKTVPLDVTRTPILSKKISLNLEGVTVREALAAIQETSGLKLIYGREIVGGSARVSISAEKITVAAALTDVLLNSGIDVVFTRSGSAALVAREEGKAPLPAGSITGRVIDSTTRAGLSGITVAVEGTKLATTTGADGGYTISGVPTGPQSIVARRIGYRTHRRAVAVVENESVTADIVLARIPTSLSEVVVTATGEQKRLELGNVVGRINADSIVREAPITSVSELLTSRVPGLQVFQTQGIVGGRVNLQSRGRNSVSVSNEPIVIIDGIRYTTAERHTPLGDLEGTNSPLNDLNPNDIEFIELAKGPSAATLYGTDAANGVIVITTKRGRPGPARWNAYAKRTTMKTPTDRIPDIYWGWGTVFGTPNNPNASCTLEYLLSGYCTKQDSVTTLPRVLQNPKYTVIAAKPTSEYGANVSGGTNDLRYYLSGDFKDEIGPVQMPLVFQDSLKARLGLTALPRKWREPNTATNMNLRSNVSIVLGPKADVRVSSGYIRSSTNAATFVSNAYEQGMFNRATPADPVGYRYDTPDKLFSQTSTDDVDRFVGSVSSEWRPMQWLSGRATLGLDILGSHEYSLAEASADRSGEIRETRTRQTSTTGDMGLSATTQRGSLSARTSVGMQYTHTLSDASGVNGTGLAPGQRVIPGARNFGMRVSWVETAVLGGYVEEMVGLNNRLFLTGAARMDGASAFGKNFEAAIYPKIGVSWLLTSEPFMPHVSGLDEVRLRAALGAAGQQPNANWVRPMYAIGDAFVNGEPRSTYYVYDLGNPDLRPERTRELEYGVDIGAFEQRLTVEATAFARRTSDQLITVSSPPGLGNLRDNLGLTTQHGFEAKIDARVLDTRAVSVDVGLQHSYYTTKLVSLGGGRDLRYSTGGYAEGYPLGSRFQLPLLGWNDQNGDGILAFNEIQYSDTGVYVGQSFPPRTQTLSTVFGFLDRQVRTSVLFERKSGFTVVDPYQCILGTCRGLVDRTASLEEQAQALFMSVGAAKPQPGDFIRLREISLAVDIPQRLTSKLGLHRSTLVFSGRNLALWSKFDGTDPEINGSGWGTPMTNVGAGAAGGVPLGRVLSVRLDLGF